MGNLDVFKNYYKVEKERLNSVIDKYNRKLFDLNDNTLNYNLNLFRNLNTNGKLIRGVLINLGYNFFDNKDKYHSDDLSLAYELFQTSILIHDDIIDNDNKRRGCETVHYSNYKKYNSFTSNIIELNNISSSVGICIGDYGLYLSNSVISNSYKDDKNLGNVLCYFNDIVLKTIHGELLDVVLPLESKYNIIDNSEIEDKIMNIYKLKTAYYTIVGPICLGMILAGTDDDKLNDIEEFGLSIGTAFQIQDDILGVYSNDTGKVIGSDIKEFKQTILYSYTQNTEYKNQLSKYYGKENLTNDDIDNIRKIFKDAGSYDYAYNYMNNLYEDGLKKLEKINWLNKQNKAILSGLVEYLRKRNK